MAKKRRTINTVSRASSSTKHVIESLKSIKNSIKSPNTQNNTIYNIEDVTVTLPDTLATDLVSLAEVPVSLPTTPTAIAPLNLDLGEVSELQQEEGWKVVSKHKTVMINTETTKPKQRLKLTTEDTEPEVMYWKTAIVCYILGANPPPVIISGFVNRIWKKYGYDKLSFLPNGLFLVHFPTEDAQQQVLQGGFHLFDNKPLIIQPWSSDLELIKAPVTRVPVWIRLYKVNLKYWGENCLIKIASEIGKVLKLDERTIQKTHLEFARVMVEMEINQELKYEIEFEDEFDQVDYIMVDYEWKPVSCKGCQGFGHQETECRRKLDPGTKQVWRPKAQQAVQVPEPVVPVTQVPVPGPVVQRLATPVQGGSIIRPNVSYVESLGLSALLGQEPRGTNQGLGDHG
ncbi:hypothetical protein vseg_019730 [Gypsophila vaccaria]